MSTAVTLDDEALATAREPRSLFGFVKLQDAAKRAVAHIRPPRARDRRECATIAGPAQRRAR